eukprot:2301932-Amphidinium_carterae.1
MPSESKLELPIGSSLHAADASKARLSCRGPLSWPSERSRRAHKTTTRRACLPCPTSAQWQQWVGQLPPPGQLPTCDTCPSAYPRETNNTESDPQRRSSASPTGQLSPT